MLVSQPQASHMLAQDGMYCNYILAKSIPVSTISGTSHHVGFTSSSFECIEGNVNVNIAVVLDCLANKL